MPSASGVWSDGEGEAGASWPLQRWARALQAMLCSAAWETRHGAASAVRELLRARIVAGAGKRRDRDLRQVRAHRITLYRSFVSSNINVNITDGGRPSRVARGHRAETRLRVGVGQIRRLRIRSGASQVPGVARCVGT